MIHFYLLTGLLDGVDTPAPPSTGGGGGISSWYEFPAEFERAARRLAERIRERARVASKRKAKKVRAVARAAEEFAQSIAAPGVDPVQVAREVEAHQRFLAMLDWMIAQNQQDAELVALQQAVAQRIADDEEAIAVLLI